MIRARGFDLGRSSQRKKAKGKKKQRRSRRKRNDFVVNSIAEVVDDGPIDKEMPNPKRQRQDDSENIDELLRRVEEDMVTVGNKDDRSLRPRSKVQADDVSVFQKYVGGTAKCNWKGKWMPVTIEGIDDGEAMAIIEWTIDGKPGRVEWWQLKDLCPPVEDCCESSAFEYEGTLTDMDL